MTDPTATPPTTPIERLATGLRILADHDPKATPGFTFVFGTAMHTVNLQSRGDDATDTALRALGWQFAENGDECVWGIAL